MDIAIIGNIIIDHVYLVANFQEGASHPALGKYKTVGAIANVLEALTRLNPALKIGISSSIGNDTEGRYAKSWFKNFQVLNNTKLVLDVQVSNRDPTSQALIICDTERNLRSSIVQWGACTEMTNFDETSAKWCHIMYADKLKNLDIEILKKIKKTSIISMDFCLESHTDEEIEKMKNILKYVDYAIMSIEEAGSISGQSQNCLKAKKIGQLVEKYAIIHSPRRIYISDGAEIIEYETDHIEEKKLNVLGAGDIFAASVISHALDNDNIMDTVRFAHQFTTQQLMERNA